MEFSLEENIHIIHNCPFGFQSTLSFNCCRIFFCFLKFSPRCQSAGNNVQQWTWRVKIRTRARRKTSDSEVSAPENQGEDSSNVASSCTWGPIKPWDRSWCTLKTGKSLLKRCSQSPGQQQRVEMQLSTLVAKSNLWKCDSHESRLVSSVEQRELTRVVLPEDKSAKHKLNNIYSEQCEVLWPAVNNGGNKQAVHMCPNTEEPVYQDWAHLYICVYGRTDNL